MKKTSKSSEIALGGVFSGLCLLIMFLTGLIPFGTYAFPALAGAMLTVVLIENGSKVATMVYISVSFLSFFVVPDREAAMMFVFFFGYYPIVRKQIEKLKYKLVQFVLKFLLFNAAILLAYFLMIFVMGMPDLLSEMGELGKYSAYILLGSGNLVFFMYDYALGKYILLYIYRIREKLSSSD